MNISGSSFGANATAPFKNVNKSSGDGGNKSGNNRIDQLTSQREEVVRRKNALIAKTTQENRPLSSIKEQLKIYDQQIENLNSEIAKENARIAEEAQKAQEENKKSAKPVETRPKTEAEVNSDKLNSVTKLGNALETVKTVDSIRSETEGLANVTEIEIELDQTRRNNFIAAVKETNPAAAETLQKRGHSLDSKVDKLEGLKQRIIELSETLGEGVGQIQQEIEDIRMQEKIQNLVEKWNKAESGTAEEPEDNLYAAPKDSPLFLDEAFKKAYHATTDFLDKYSDWSKEAMDKGLVGGERDDFLYDKLEEWEKNLQKTSPDEYEAWKQVTASVDIFA